MTRRRFPKLNSLTGTERWSGYFFAHRLPSLVWEWERRGETYPGAAYKMEAKLPKKLCFFAFTPFTRNFNFYSSYEYYSVFSAF